MTFPDYEQSSFKNIINISDNMVIKKLFIVMVLLYSGIISAYNNQEFVIKHICFDGLRRVPEKTILFNIPIHSGDILNRKSISHIIQTLFSIKFFENICVLRKNDTLIFKFKERPLISNIIFTGNKLIKDDVLKHNLEDFNISNGEFLDYSMLFNFKQKIIDFYHSIGKYHATVNIVKTLLPYNLINLKFIFQEGESASIRQINIIGNHAFSTSTLLSGFQLHDKTFWLDKIIRNPGYQKQILAQDLEYLSNYYFDHGYIRFNIDSVHVNLTPNKKEIYITINVTENDQYKLACISTDSNSLDHAIEIQNLAKIKTKRFFNKKTIQKVEENIKRLLGRYGYADPSIKTHFEINDSKKIVKLHLYVDVGHRFYVRKICFKGNHISKDIVLRREVRQIEGSWLNTDFINQGKERLNRLGYFERVNFQTRSVVQQPDQVDIIYQVKERNTGSFNFGIGFGTESGINFQIGIQQDNWIGSGNAVGITGVKNNYQTYSEIFISNPYITVNGISASSRGFYNNFKASDADLSTYTNKRYGIDGTIGFLISENSTLNFGLSYIHNDLSHIKPQVSIWRYLNSINYSKNGDNFNTNDFTFNYEWIYNKLNCGVFPTKGTRLNLDNKITILKSNNKFYKLTFDLASYFPIVKNQKWVFLSRTRLGYGNGLGTKEMPFYENFYAGGFNTVRGFQSNNIGPKATYYHNSGKKNCEQISFSSRNVYSSTDAIGGNAMILSSISVIVPTPFINTQYSSSIRTSLFVDAGSIWDTKWDNKKYPDIIDYSNPKNIRISTGIALQWISPFGPISFSYSQPIKKYYGDKIEQFQFYIGKTW